jgi:hypothetical protein
VVLIGLTGGIGNALFALPTIKRLFRVTAVGLVVDCDYDAENLFRRCAYIRKVYSKQDALPRATRYIACYSVPAAMQGLPVERVGWLAGTFQYPHPEWMQIKSRSGCGESPEDVTDWCGLLNAEKKVDVGLAPCGKPRDEWSRKRWSGFLQLTRALVERGHSVEVFGQMDEVESSGLKEWWGGPCKLEQLPDRLVRCRIVISNDCGPGHLASSVGVPTLMLFMATSPVKGQPVGPHRIIATGCERAPSGCQSTPIWQACTDWKCTEISVERVLAEALDMLVKK